MRKNKIPLWAPVLVMVAAVLLVTLSTGGTDAAKGGSRGGSSISVPHGVFGGTTTATVNPGGDGVWVHAGCFQGGTLVYEQYVEADSNMQATLQLGPTPSWTGGDADCAAEEGYFGKSGRWHSIASTTFHVDG